MQARTGKPGRLKGLFTELKKNHAAYLLLAPALLLVLTLSYLPMSGIVLAFKSFKYNLGIFGSPWIGFENFRFFFMTGTGWNVTLNTITYNLVNLITLQTTSVILAIFISESRNVAFKKITQSMTFLPYFISWVVVGMLAYNIFNFESGIMNTMLKANGMKPYNIYADTGVWRFVIPFVNIWKWVGYTSVIYIAAIAGVDQECFESADIDGANILQKNLYITIPCIAKSIIIMVLLNVGRILRGDFQMFYQLVGNNGQLFKATDVIDTFVFRSLLTSSELTMSSAATFYQSVLCFVIIFTVNGLVRRVDKDSALF